MKVTDDRKSIRGRISLLLAMSIVGGLTGCVTHTEQQVSIWRTEPTQPRSTKSRNAKASRKPAFVGPIAPPIELQKEKPDVISEVTTEVTSKDSVATPNAPIETLPAGPAAENAPPPASLKNDLRPKAPAPILGLAGVRAKVNNEAHLIFDFPVTYNSRVKKWIKYFQTAGRPSFRRWLERSSRFVPFIQTELKKAGLPLDLVYVAMIESGFSSNAASHANAIGLWQFIVPTGERYGLKYDWWIDERRDFEKATRAAIGYMSDLFEQFGSWYLVTASYNMGENGVRRLIKRYRTNSYWDLVERGALPDETGNYVPKMLAAILIAKAPALYGFRDLEMMMPFAFDTVTVPGGTDLANLARYLGVSERTLTELNPELLRGFIPRDIGQHRIRIPKGAHLAVSQYVAMTNPGTQIK